MPRRFFFSLNLVLALLLFPWSREAFAQEQTEPSAVQEQSKASEAPSAQLAPLPPQPTDAQMRALQELPPAALRFSLHARRRLPWFYRGAYNRPLTPREVAFRESIYELARRRKQFVHVRLVDGEVLTGTINYTSVEKFQLQTGVFGGGRLVPYRQLAEPPMPVLAVGTKVVRGLQVTGMVGVCIVLLPVALVIYPLIAAGVIQD